MLWLSNRTVTLMLAARAVNSWTYVVTLGCSFSMVGHMVTNQGEFTCLANGGRNIVDYIVGSPVVWQVATHLEVIIDDTRYYAMGGNSDHSLLHLRLNIDCNFVEPRHTVVTNKFLPRFKYYKSKAEEYQLALIASLGNLWVVDSIGHLGANGLVDLLQ